jgi:LuxR family maltose regulon positive regulatory protein
VRAFLLDVLVRLGETAQADGSAPGSHQVWQIAAFLLEASARDALGEREAAGRALERGPDLAEPAGLLFPFLLYPMPELLERHARQRTVDPALIRKIIGALGGRTPAVPAAARPKPASCASCRRAFPRRRSPASFMCR